MVRSATIRQTELAGQCPGVKHFLWCLADDETTLDTAREVIENLVKLKHTCTCYVRTCSKCQSLDSKQLGGDICNHVKKCPCCRKNTVQDTEVNHSLGADRIVLYEEKCAILDAGSTLAASNDTKNLRNSCMLLGLHACADLSPIIMKIFRDCSQASSLVLLSCCYHKLKPLKQDSIMSNGAVNDTKERSKRASCTVSVEGDARSIGTHSQSQEVNMNDHSREENSESPSCQEGSDNGSSNTDAAGFLNFPMSQTLRGILDRHKFQMTVFGLRMGAQESGVKWQNQTPEQHECHWKNVAFRGLLEVFCQQGETLKMCSWYCVGYTAMVVQSHT